MTDTVTTMSKTDLRNAYELLLRRLNNISSQSSEAITEVLALWRDFCETENALVDTKIADSWSFRGIINYPDVLAVTLTLEDSKVTLTENYSVAVSEMKKAMLHYLRLLNESIESELA